MIDNDEMVEHVFFRGNHYGISRSEIEAAFKSGKQPLVILEPNGVNHFKDAGYSLFSIYVGGDRTELIRRFLGRLSGEVDYDARRLEGMLREVEQWPSIMEYNHKIESFSSNYQEVVDEILDLVR